MWWAFAVPQIVEIVRTYTTYSVHSIGGYLIISVFTFAWMSFTVQGVRK